MILTEPIEDTPIEWYDFGAGWKVVPRYEGPGMEKATGENMAALCCVRNGKLHYITAYGDFKTEADLATIRPALEAAFLKELSTTQETKQ